MQRIISSCLLGVVLASSVLAQPASAQIQVILGGNQRHDWREQQLQRDRQHRLEVERQHRLEVERQRRLQEERDRQQRLEIERQRERQRRLEQQRNHRDRY
ncbi:hypothetical protein NIES2100_06120 [Calothrix sp. NIES-2100]|uniref:hypothetical protein n=1 Tax=Calothrix sp. NIES-2100 TaxID=1954172 RepID=UPI000B609C46|nr:hypothetical protein NIES2100_06120 [Calothrix sp. NIES-2100]